MSNETSEQQFRMMFKGKNVWMHKLLVMRKSTPFDYLILFEHENWACEIKEWKQDKNFYSDERISPHQIAGLLNFSKIGQNFKSFIFLHKKPENHWFRIPIECIESLKKVGKTSYFDDLKQFYWLYK